MQARYNNKLLGLTAFSSGLISLGLEIVLARIALTCLGGSASAATMTITVYLCGITTGALLSQKQFKTLRLTPLLLAATPLLIMLLQMVMAQSSSMALNYFVMALALLLPSTLSSLLISACAAGNSQRNLIYTAANFGALAGALGTAFILLPGTGIRGSLWILAATMTPVALACLLSADCQFTTTTSATATAIEKEAGPATNDATWQTLATLFVASAAMTVLECDWLRFSALIFGSSSQTLATTVASVITGLALGNAAISILLQRLKPPEHKSIQLFTHLFTAGCAILSIKILSVMPDIFQYLRATELLPRITAALCSALLAFPLSFSLGLIFPLYTDSLKAMSWRKAYTIASAGAIVGPAIFLVILPETSLYTILQGSLIALTLLSLLTKDWRCVAPSLVATLVICCTSIDKRNLSAGLAYLPATAETLAAIKDPTNRNELSLVFYKDGQNNTVSVEESKVNNIRILRSDGKVEATIPIDLKDAAAGSDLNTQMMLTLLPALLHGGKPESLIIGLGSGTTSSAASKLGIAADTLEIEPAVITAAGYFQSLAGQHIINDDARTYLKNCSAYDLIISQPSEPWVSGSSSLFTKEFFSLIKDKLRSHGLAAQWLQLYGMDQQHFRVALKTFITVFPRTYIFHQEGAGEIIMVGCKDTLADLNSARKRFSSSSYRPQLAIAGIESWQNFSNSLSVVDTGKLLSSIVEPNCDDKTVLEYSQLNPSNFESQIQANLNFLNNADLIASKSVQEKADLDSQLAEDPSAFRLLNQKARTLIWSGNSAMALNYLERSRQLNPSIFETRELLALASALMGKLDLGLQETQAAHILNRQNCRPYLIAACIYQLKGNGTEARSNLNMARQNCLEDEILKQVDSLETALDSALDHSGQPGTLKSILIRLSQVS